MPSIVELKGKKFTRLTVICRKANDDYGHSMWLCECDCGKKKTITSYSLTHGVTRSCGCLRVEKTRHISTIHGHSHRNKMSRTYKSWASMIQRCANPKDKAYYNYGERGIAVCRRWIIFENFLEDMGEAPKGYQIDRTDNNRGYNKNNCRWVTPKQNNRNKRNNHLIEFQNKIKCLSAWAEEIGVNSRTLWKRFSDGWSVERALTTPKGKKRKGTK